MGAPNEESLRQELVRRIPLLRKLRTNAGRLMDTAYFLARGPQYKPILGYLFVDGWLSYAEAVSLYELAKGLPPEHPVIVELGSWQGKSSLILAKGIASKRHPVLYCIDPFDATDDGARSEDYSRRQSQMSSPLLNQFIDNMKKNRVYEVAKVLRGMSYEFSKGFTEKIDLLFIDANHEYDAVMRDFEEWSPHLKPGGIIAFHDVVTKESSQGPGRVVTERIRENTAWTEQRLVDSLYIARKAH
jgi:predicted O-methyltransferase YrrM